jgi:hypothetical protein
MKLTGKIAVFLAMAVLLGVVGCTTESVETRRRDQWMAYSALPEGQRELVDQGRIRAGMGADAVAIAWGKASEVAQPAASNDEQVIWRYPQAKGHWHYREFRQGAQPVLEQVKKSAGAPGTFAQAEIIFRQGRVAGWRLLP